jgi:hypothetical protein
MEEILDMTIALEYAKIKYKTIPYGFMDRLYAPVLP